MSSATVTRTVDVPGVTVTKSSHTFVGELHQLHNGSNWNI